MMHQASLLTTTSMFGNRPVRSRTDYIQRGRLSSVRYHLHRRRSIMQAACRTVIAQVNEAGFTALLASQYPEQRRRVMGSCYTVHRIHCICQSSTHHVFSASGFSFRPRTNAPTAIILAQFKVAILYIHWRRKAVMSTPATPASSRTRLPRGYGYGELS